MFYVTQTIPEGVPQLLKPDFSKLDINKLKADIPKYPKAGVPKEKMMFWQTIEKHLQKIEAKSQEPVGGWVLETLKRRMNQLEQSPHHPTPLIPDELTSVRVKETAPLPEVKHMKSLATTTTTHIHTHTNTNTHYVFFI